jgi:hypothetical protein
VSRPRSKWENGRKDVDVNALVRSEGERRRVSSFLLVVLLSVSIDPGRAVAISPYSGF